MAREKVRATRFVSALASARMDSMEPVGVCGRGVSTERMVIRVPRVPKGRSYASLHLGLHETGRHGGGHEHPWNARARMSTGAHVVHPPQAPIAVWVAEVSGLS